MSSGAIERAEIRNIKRTLFRGKVSFCEAILNLPGEDDSCFRFLCAWKTFNPEERNTANEAVSQALSKWNPEKHGFEKLSKLVRIVRETQNTSTIPALTSLIDTHVVSDEENTQKSIIQAIAGFAKEPEARDALTRWYNDPEFSWEYTAYVCIGLMRCIPDNTQQYLDRLINTLSEHPGFYNIKDLVNEMSSISGPDHLKKILNHSEHPVALKLLAFVPYEEKEELSKNEQSDKDSPLHSCFMSLYEIFCQRGK